MEKIKVLIVDDSLFMRQAIARIITNDSIEVIDTAKNGKEAIEKVKALKPDVVTMDIEMPIMTGMEACKIIMENTPVPILMLSTLTSEGADATIDALSYGAVDFITKKAAFKEMDSLKDELIEKIISLGRNPEYKNRLIRSKLLRSFESAKTERPGDDISDTSRKNRPGINDLKIVSIGISTGGPVALIDLLKHFPSDFPVPIVIVQHMPPFFTKSLAERLDSLCHINVKEAQDGEKLERGWCYIAPGGKQMSIKMSNHISIGESMPDQLFNPSANILFESVSRVFGKACLGVIMTGMGNDGTDGLKLLKRNGGYILAQDPETCVVSGMTKSVIDSKLANEIVSLNHLPTLICSLFGKKTVAPKLIKKEFIR